MALNLNCRKKNSVLKSVESYFVPNPKRIEKYNDKHVGVPIGVSISLLSPLYHKDILYLYIILYKYSLVSNLSSIYPFPAMHSLLVTIISNWH